jgi:hypothetical protein
MNISEPNPLVEITGEVRCGSALAVINRIELTLRGFASYAFLKSLASRKVGLQNSRGRREIADERPKRFRGVAADSVVKLESRCTSEDIVQCTIYLADIALWAEVNDTYIAFFSAVAVLPARTVVPVKEMHYGARVQIQPIAWLKGW